MYLPVNKRSPGSGFGVWGLGSGVWGLVSGVWGLGTEVWGLGFGVWGLGLVVRGLRFGVQSLELWKLPLMHARRCLQRPRFRVRRLTPGHISHYKAASGTNWSNRWTNRVSITNADRK